MSKARPKKRHYAGYGNAALPKKSRGLNGAGRLGSLEFFNLLRRRDRGTAHDIDHEIEARGVTEGVVLASDSSGFSRKTKEYGIIQFLAVMTQCYDRLIPLLEKRGGICLSHNADNILAVFERPADAVRAAVDMQRWCARRNRDLPDAEQFNICIGINWGKLLRLKDNVFGDPVNIAAKIGEDVAARDEILVTEKVAKSLKEDFSLKSSKTVELGGRSIGLFRVVY